jgi:acyl-[acyl carrier protein]--UDP-N-acetylglucosamine O-acyltransferase
LTKELGEDKIEVFPDRRTGMEAVQMTDKQFDKIIKMIRMVLDGCKDLDEAKKKVEELLEDQHEKGE